MEKKEIIVGGQYRRGDNVTYTASIKDTRIYATGDSAAEAIGNLINNNAYMFNVSIVINHPSD